MKFKAIVNDVSEYFYSDDPSQPIVSITLRLDNQEPSKPTLRGSGDYNTNKFIVTCHKGQLKYQLGEKIVISVDPV